jgi:hypothetical protein
LTVAQASAAILQGIEADLHERSSSSVYVLDVLSAACAAMDTLAE